MNDKIRVTIGNEVFSGTLSDGQTAAAFKHMLPLILDMSELNGNEKYADLPFALPSMPVVPPSIAAGDIMLYGKSTVVIFYKSFSTSYAYTRLGRLNDSKGLAAALGKGNAKVKFEIQ